MATEAQFLTNPLFSEELFSDTRLSRQKKPLKIQINQLDQFMRNKANLPDAQMNLTKALANDYVIFRLRSRFKNKAKQSQSCRGVAFLPPRSLGEGGGKAGTKPIIRIQLENKNP